MSDKQLSQFEVSKYIDEGGEYWLARELAPILQYSRFQTFVDVIKKAAEACKNSGQQIRDHFTLVSKMVDIGSGAIRDIGDYKLSRYACYLIVQNGNPKNKVIAEGQTYFAAQTRLQEIQQSEEYAKLQTEEEKRLYLRSLLTEHNKILSATAKTAGVVKSIDFAIFKNHGYKGLYNGLDRKGIQTKKKLKEADNILDFMGSTELAANLFLSTQTDEKIKKDNIRTRDAANKTHYEVGTKIRKTIKEIGGTMPEDLPTAENIKKIEKKSQKKLNEKNKDGGLTSV